MVMYYDCTNAGIIDCFCKFKLLRQRKGIAISLYQDKQFSSPDSSLEPKEKKRKKKKEDEGSA